MVQLAENPAAGSYRYMDKYLENDNSTSYQVGTVDAAGAVVAESDIVSI